MGYRDGIDFVDPIQQGIKTFATLKEIDRADAANARADRADVRAEKEFATNQAAAGIRMDADKLRLKSDEFNLLENRKAAVMKEATQKLAYIKAEEAEYRSKNGGLLKGFKPTAQYATFAGELSKWNPTYFTNDPEKILNTTAGLDVVSDGADRVTANDSILPDKVSFNDPGVMEALNVGLGNEIQKGNSEYGNNAGKSIAQVNYDKAKKTFSFVLNITDANGNSYQAPLTSGRGPDDKELIVEVPANVMSEYAKQNAAFGRSAILASTHQPEAFNQGFSIPGLEAYLDPGAADKNLERKEKTLRITALEDAANDAKATRDAKETIGQWNLDFKSKPFDETRANEAYDIIIKGDSTRPAVTDKATQAKIKETLLGVAKAHKKNFQHVTTGGGVYAFDPETGKRGEYIGPAPATHGGGAAVKDLTKAEEVWLQGIDHRMNRASISAQTNQGRLKDTYDPKEKAALQAQIDADLLEMKSLSDERKNFFNKRLKLGADVPTPSDEKPKANPAGGGLSQGIQLADGRVDKRLATGAQGVFDGSQLPAGAVPAGLHKDGRPAFKLPNGKLVVATISR